MPKFDFNLIKNCEESQYIKRLPYIRDNGPEFTNNVSNLLKNGDDVKMK